MFAPSRIALCLLEEVFQRLDRVTLTGSTNRYFTLKPLQLVDAVVRAVVTEDFALGPAVRGWLGFMDGACLDWVEHRDVDRETLHGLLLGTLMDAVLAANEATGS